MRLLSVDSPLFSGGLKLLIPFFENLFIFTVKFICRCNITDSAVEPDIVVMIDAL